MKKNLFIFILLFSLIKLSISQNCGFTPLTYTIPNGPSSNFGYTFINDFNNDNKKDYVVQTNSVLNIFLQTTNNSFNTLTMTVNDNLMASEDFNNDGKIDLLTFTTFYAGQGNGTFIPTALSSSITSFYSGPSGYTDWKPISYDLNGDNKMDIIVPTWPAVNVYLGSGNGTFSAPNSYSTNGGSSISIDKINNDNIPDIAVCSISGTVSTITIFAGLGNGTFSVSNTFSLSGLSFGIKIADLNNDNKADLIINFNNSPNIIYLLGNGNGTFGNPINIPLNTKRLLAFDLNSDGKKDLISQNLPASGSGPGTATINIIYNNGNLNFAGLTTYTFISAGTQLADLLAGDLNNDSKMDLATTTWSSTVGHQNTVLFSDQNCVWPGDANSDGFANNLDILEIGLQFNQTGAARTNTSNIWNGYSYTAWTGSVSTGKNKAHADCNGDGTVNFNDTVAVFNNYGFMHNKIADIEMVNPDISIVPDQINVLKNTWGTASIFLGDASSNISNIHGVAFTVNYDNSIIETDSVWIEYTSSFINSNNLHFRKRVFSDGVIYTATTHTNQVNANGNGKIATLHYKIKPTLSSNTVLNLGISNGSKLSATAITSTLSTGNGTLNAVTTDVGIKESSLNGQIIVYPNPSKGQLTIKQIAKSNFVDFITIYNTTGQIVLSRKIESSTEKLDTHLSKGVYFYILSNSAGQIFKDKLIIE
jgi:hypothetical protein